MIDDASENSPGRKVFWEDFYDDSGRLHQKHEDHRKSSEVKEGGSLMDHYEWFMRYPAYESCLCECMSTLLENTCSHIQPFRILHIGCGNSDYCDHARTSLDRAFCVKAQQQREPVVLNVDICSNIISHLSTTYPSRLYAVGNCCSMTSDNAVLLEDEWYSLSGDVPPILKGIKDSSVDFVFDKGTMDALLSAFSGEYNPNVAAYAQEALHTLRPGGVFFVISINSEDIVNPYYLGASSEDKYFSLRYRGVIELSKGDLNAIRVETLGSRYNCYGFKVLTD